MIEKIITAVELARPKLREEVKLPDTETTARYINSAFYIARNGNVKVLGKARKAASEDERAFLSILRWNIGFSGPDITSLMIASWRFTDRDSHDRAESLALVLGQLLTGRNRNADAWRKALHGE